MARDEMIAVTEFRTRLNDALERLRDRNIVLLRHSSPAAVVMSHERYEALLDRIEDLEDNLAVALRRLDPDAEGVDAGRVADVREDA